MNDQQKMVADFMRAFGQDVPSTFTARGYPVDLRVELIREEAEEFAEAVKNGKHIAALDALCDLLYVTYGAACAYGVDLEPLFAEVHRSNMSKLGEDGKPIYREDGKVLKSQTYSPPTS
jgi:predicted HAD superfamily Cof-like phosphohydrolase